MKEVSEWLLGKIISSDGSNNVACNLLEIIHGGNDIDKIDWLTLFAKTTTNVVNYKKNNPLQIELEESRDFRMEWVKIRGFRKYPYKENGYYTLAFSNSIKGCPCSCFYIGSNGSGKTSIFSSLQETCSDSFSAADSRGIKRQSFMPHVGKDASFVDVIVKTKEDEIELQNPSKSLLFPIRQFLRPFFCSEYDVRMMSEAKDITGYIINQTGFGYTYNLIEHLKKMYDECCNRKDVLTRKKEKVQLSDGGEKTNKRLKCDFLNAVFDDIVGYRYRNTKVRNSLSNIVEKLSKPLKIKSISRNSKNYTKNILKAADQSLPEILSKLKQEQQMLLSSNLCGKTINETYQTLIYAITDLLIDFEDQKNYDTPQNGIQKLYPRIRFNSLYERLQNIGLNLFNEKREWYSEAIAKLQSSIAEEEKSKVFVEKFLKEINSYNADLNGENVSEVEELDFLENNLDKLKECIEKLQKFYYSCLYKSSNTTKEFCEMILNQFNMSEEKIEFNVDKITGRLSINYVVNGSYIDPVLYLNSFRFKLYTLCIKIGMAFSVMQLLKISFPIVFDDVFYSSDFSNREKVCLFIKETFDLYHKVIEPVTKLPLQIIFFTHDEVILDAAVNGMKELDDAYVYGRIFNYQEMDNVENDTDNPMNCKLSIVF